MTPQDAWLKFRGLSRPVQLAVGAGVLVVAIVVVLWLAGGLESAWSRFNDWRFDRRAEQAEQERDALRVERDAAIDRAEAAEAQAAVYEEQVATLTRLAADAGLTAREKARRAEEIERATETAIERAGADPATAADEYRAALRRLGYLK